MEWTPTTPSSSRQTRSQTKKVSKQRKIQTNGTRESEVSNGHLEVVHVDSSSGVKPQNPALNAETIHLADIHKLAVIMNIWKLGSLDNLINLHKQISERLGNKWRHIFLGTLTGMRPQLDVKAFIQALRECNKDEQSRFSTTMAVVEFISKLGIEDLTTFLNETKFLPQVSCLVINSVVAFLFSSIIENNFLMEVDQNVPEKIRAAIDYSLHFLSNNVETFDLNRKSGITTLTKYKAYGQICNGLLKIIQRDLDAPPSLIMDNTFSKEEKLNFFSTMLGHVSQKLMMGQSINLLAIIIDNDMFLPADTNVFSLNIMCEDRPETMTLHNVIANHYGLKSIQDEIKTTKKTMCKVLRHLYCAYFTEKQIIDSNEDEYQMLHDLQVFSKTKQTEICSANLNDVQRNERKSVLLNVLKLHLLPEMSVIAEHFQDWIEDCGGTDCFLNVDKESLITFLDLDSINISEYIVYEILARWSSFQAKNIGNPLYHTSESSEYFKQVRHVLRLELLSDKFSVIAKHGFISIHDCFAACHPNPAREKWWSTSGRASSKAKTTAEIS